MKRIIIIILLILGIGITIFTIYYLKQDRFVVDKVIDEPVNIELETEEETVDEYFNNKDYDDLNKIEPSDDEINIERKWNSKDDKFMYSTDLWNTTVFPKLCKRNGNWMLDVSQEEYFDKMTKDSINAKYYVTQNILDNYDEMSGLLSDLSYDEIINLYFNYFTEQLEVKYLFLDNEYDALYKVEIVKKDNHNKINNLILLYNSLSEFTPVEKDKLTGVFESLIKKGYDYELPESPFETYDYNFIPSDEWLEKYPDYRFLGEIDKITNIDTFENSKDDINNYSWDNKWINIVIETIEDDKYIKYYYRINYKTGDNYCLTDCEKTLVKKTMGETIEQREKRLAKEQEEMEKLISQMEEETRDNRQIEDIEISNERKNSDDIDEELLNKFKEEQSKLNEEKN